MPNSRQKRSICAEALAFSDDAVNVLTLRSARIIAGGPSGQAEARLMVAEKIAAFAKVQWNLVTGVYGFTPQGMTSGVIDHYVQAVRANRHRLARWAAKSG